MQVFIWTNLEHATGSYHPEGGLTVVAETLPRALELARAAGVEFAENRVETYWSHNEDRDGFTIEQVINEKVLTHYDCPGQDRHGKPMVDRQGNPMAQIEWTIDERIPSRTYKVEDDAKEEVFVFPNAGCC